METKTNPFEPPRTVDLDGIVAGAPGPLTLSSEALREMVATAPWLRWLSRLTSLWIAVELVKGVADVVHASRFAWAAGRLFVVSLSTAIATAMLMAWRRYAAASDRLRAGAPGAASDVIAAQLRSLKVLGTTFACLIAVVALLVAIYGAARLVR
jgi:hypothetical protein